MPHCAYDFTTYAAYINQIARRASMWAQYVLFVNAIWDLVTGAAILIYVSTHRLKWLADTHLGLWNNEEDRNNDTASVIMAFLLLQWSWVRLITSLDPVDHWQDAVYSYWLEGALIGLATFSGRMYTLSGYTVVVLCVACAGVVLMEAFRP